MRPLRLVDRRRCASAFRTSVEAQPDAGERRRVDLNAHRRLLAAADDDLTDAVHLRDLLREDGVRRVEDLRRAAASRDVSERIRIGESAGFTLR